MSFASLSGATVLPIEGPAPPTLEVEKNTGSIESKSRSSRMRSIRTEPTMPRQPTKPTVVMIVSLGLDSRLRGDDKKLVLERFDHRHTHLGSGHRFLALGGDVTGSEALG